MSKILNSNDPKTVEHRFHAKYSQIADEAEQMRLRTLANVRVASDGSVAVSPSPGLHALQDRIADEEARLARLEEISDKIQAILAKNGAGTVADLREAKANADNVLFSSGNAAWDRFVVYRGKGGVGANNRTHMLPSDIAQVPEFKKEEDKIRADIDAAKAALPALAEACNSINQLVAEIDAV